MKPVLLGVVHGKFSKAQLKRRKKKKLPLGGNIRKAGKLLRKYRKKGFTKMGIEVYLPHAPPLKQIPKRKRSAWTYFRHFTRFGKKLGYHVYNIEDIAAHQLSKLFDLFSAEENLSWVKPFLPMNADKWSTKKMENEFKRIKTAIDHYRSLRMYEIMHEKGIEIAIMGAFHAEYAPRNKFKIIIVDDRDKVIKGTATEKESRINGPLKPTFYSSYAHLIPKMLRVFKRTKLYKKMDKIYPIYTRRKI